MIFLQKLLHYAFTPLYALLLFAELLALMSAALPPDSYAYGIIFSRGPANYLMLYTALYVLITSVSAGVRRDYNAKILIVLFSLCILIIILGVMGTVMGMASAISYFLTEVLAQTDNIAALRNQFAIGLAISLDTTLLALVCCSWLLPLITLLGIIAPKENSPKN